MGPEHDGQLNGAPVRSCEIRLRACAGLYVAGRGLRIRLLLLQRYITGQRQAPVFA